jgi:hypothetical protein
MSGYKKPAAQEAMGIIPRPNNNNNNNNNNREY